MPRTLLVSIGTSIAGPAREGTPLNQLQKCPQGWDTDAPGLEEQIRTRLAGLDLRSERGRIQASAELNALHRLGCRDDDDVVLLATDTADGRCCAEALATVIEREFGCRRPRLERIAGLQVHDAERLRREGLVALCRTLIRYLDDPQRRHGGGCIVCPNGGFKGIVPFLTLLAMAFRAPSVYVFEHAETLIRLPPLPMTIDRKLLARASDALGWAQQQGLFDVSAFLARIPGLASEERELFESLLETVPDASGRQLAALSPLIEALVVERGLASNRLRLSPRALDQLAQLEGRQRKEVHDFLRKLASPLWREQHGQTKVGSDLRFAPGGHCTWRFAWFCDPAGGVHLCWFAQHDEYENRIHQPEYQRAAFPEADFVDWQEPETEQTADPHAHAGLSWDTLSARVLELERELADLRRRLNGPSRAASKAKPKPGRGYRHPRRRD